MPRIEHRRMLVAHQVDGDGTRLPAVGRLFVVLAAVVGAAELWPVANAIMVGATEWWSEIPDLLAPTARAAALVALPAAVAWASPAAPRANRWLWNGAVILAVGQLARYPGGLIAGALATGDDELSSLAVLALSVVLAMTGILGTWALSEGIRDAGGRVSRAVVAGLAIGVAALVILAFGPGLTTARELDLGALLTGTSLVVAGLLLLAHAGLAARVAAGALAGLRPIPAWRAGAAGSLALLLVPVISLGMSVVSQLVRLEDLTIVTALMVLTLVGWPLVALALGAGMGATGTGRRSSSHVVASFRLDAAPRFEAAVTG